MKYLTALFCIGSLLMLTRPAAPTVTKAQSETDTIRDLLAQVHDKQPDTQVTLDFISKSYSPSGSIAHIGDDYVCIFESAQVEFCSPLEKLQAVRLYPGIHR